MRVLAVSRRLFRLTFETLQTSFLLGNDVFKSIEIKVRPLHGFEGIVNHGVVPAHARRLLENGAAFLGAGLQQCVHSPLFDNTVRLRADARPSQNFPNVF